MEHSGGKDMSATVDAVIVTHNSAHLIEVLLRIPLATPRRNGQIIVSDSGSSDGTHRIVSSFRDTLLITSESRGFGAACNAGAHHGRSDYIAFVNPDVSLTWPQLAQLALSAAHLGASAIAPVLLDGSSQVSSAGSRSICPPWRHRGSIVPHKDDPYHVETATGACLILKREVFQRMGGFDERYFLYAEEDDLLKRVRNGGGSVVVDPRIQVVHLGQASSTGVPGWWRTMHRMRSHRLYIAKHFSRYEGLLDGLVSSARLLTSRKQAFRLKTLVGLWKP
jgi:N-acetylglucosaminyl-diphospho-decaprenol L-rhamnosyltransferase